MASCLLLDFEERGFGELILETLVSACRIGDLAFA
jgi:hypothetical protein